MQKDYTVRVAWDDTDCTKRVYLGKYIKWLDDAATEYLRDSGLTFDMEGWLWWDGKELNESFVVGEYSMRMLRTSGFDELLTVKVSVKERRNRVVVFKGDIFNEEGQQCASGTLTYIYIRRKEAPKGGRGKAGQKAAGTPIESAEIPGRLAKMLPVVK